MSSPQNRKRRTSPAASATIYKSSAFGFRKSDSSGVGVARISDSSVLRKHNLWRIMRPTESSQSKARNRNKVKRILGKAQTFTFLHFEKEEKKEEKEKEKNGSTVFDRLCTPNIRKKSKRRRSEEINIKRMKKPSKDGNKEVFSRLYKEAEKKRRTSERAKRIKEIELNKQFREECTFHPHIL